MFRKEPTAALIISWIIAGLLVLASASGLFLKSLYRDNMLVTAGWHGNDIVTLYIAVPLLVAALIISKRGVVQAQFIWLGLLDYTLYNYAFYLFGAAFNRFFLIYVLLFTLSIFALLFSLPKIEIQILSQRFHQRTPVKWISGYMIFVALGLSAIEVGQSLNFVFTGTIPPVIENVEHPTNVVFALDLSLVVPFFILGAIWLWKRHPWGFIIAVILNVKGTVYMLALTVVSIFQVQAGITKAAGQTPIWGALMIGSLVASIFLLGNIKPVQSTESGAEYYG